MKHCEKLYTDGHIVTMNQIWTSKSNSIKEYGKIIPMKQKKLIESILLAWKKIHFSEIKL